MFIKNEIIKVGIFLVFLLPFGVILSATASSCFSAGQEYLQSSLYPQELPEDILRKLPDLPTYEEKATQTEVSENNYWRELRALQALIAFELQEGYFFKHRTTKNNDLIKKMCGFQAKCKKLEFSRDTGDPETRDFRLRSLKSECDKLRLEFLFQAPEPESPSDSCVIS